MTSRTSTKILTVDTLPEFTGRTINDRFFVLEILGEGGYGAVYKTRDLDATGDDTEYYAVKCMHKFPSNSRETYNQDCEFELHALVRDLPHVVSLHQVLDDGFYVYAILELCEGGELFPALLDHRFYRQDVAVKEMFLQVIQAVHEIHQSGVFHRDLKLENFVLQGSRVLLTDFGMATTDKMSDDVGMGSLTYLSPECVRGINKKDSSSSYSPRDNDVWALGIILIALLTGRNLWHEASPKDPGFTAYLVNPQHLLTSSLPLSRPAIALIQRILAVDPIRRILLPELKTEIMRMETFFMTDEELAKAGRIVKSVARSCVAPPPPSSPPSPPPAPTPTKSTLNNRILYQDDRSANTSDSSSADSPDADAASATFGTSTATSASFLDMHSDTDVSSAAYSIKHASTKKAPKVSSFKIRPRQFVRQVARIFLFRRPTPPA